MPFKKTNADSKDARSLAEARKVIIGRTSELLFFIQHVLKPEDPTYHIISISGQGGVGKSTLLSRFIDETHGVDFKDYCMVAQVNERQTTPADIMEKFAEQLSLKGDFEKALSLYKDTLRRVQSEREAAREALLRQATTDVAGSLAKTVPVMGGVLETMAGSTVGYIWEELHFRQRLKDAERLEDPRRDLTRNFVKELNLVADASVTVGLNRIRRQRRVVLFFDTFEQLEEEAAPWLLDYFLEADISSNVVLVVAERGITDPAQVDTYWQLSRGLPLFLGLLTSNAQGDIDPTKNVVDNFLRGIPKEEQVKRRLALDSACFSRPFNQDDLAAFSHVPEQEHSQFYLWLTGQPFVRSSPQDGRYIYHDLARDLFCRHLYQRSHRDYHATRRALVEHYQQQLERLLAEGGKEVYDSTEWLELVIALLHQYLLLPDEASHIRAIAEGLRMYTSVKTRGAIVEVLREEVFRLLKLLSQEPFNSQLSLGIRVVIAQLLQTDGSDLGGQEFLLGANFLIEKVGHDPAFPTELLALLYLGRAEGYGLLKNYQQAIEDYTRAIALDPHLVNAYNNRGFTYYKLKEYQRAAADYTHAIELDEKYIWPYTNRGRVYLSLKEYERAIEDFNRAIELDTKRAWIYGLRGDAYYALKEYEQAIENYNRAIELDPKFAGAYAQRGLAYVDLNEYLRAIEDYNRATELVPTYEWAYFQRGYVYLWLKDIQQAKADFTRCLELDASRVQTHLMDAWVGMCQERPDMEMVQRLEEIITATPDTQCYGTSVCRGVSLWGQGSFEQSLIKVEQSISLDPAIEDAYFWKGVICASLRRDEEAMAAIAMALELKLPPVLLTPLRWLDKDRLDFFEKYIEPWLTHYKVLNYQETSE